MGFVDNVFQNKFTRIKDWSEHLTNKVVAVDGRGGWSHPRRWQIERDLYIQALNNFKEVISNKK
jgi:hypothetical protein